MVDRGQIPEDKRAAFDGLMQRLTPREAEVMTLVAGNNTYPAIAGELKIAVGTVKVHTRRALKKMEFATSADFRDSLFGLPELPPVPIVSDDLAQRMTSLTPREDGVMREVIFGQTNKEIGARFGIAAGTVKLHVSRGLRKMKFGTRRKLYLHMLGAKTETTEPTPLEAIQRIEEVLENAAGLGANLTHRERNIFDVVKSVSRPGSRPSLRDLRMVLRT